MQAFSAVNVSDHPVPGAKRAIDALSARFVPGSTGGPDAEARAQTGSAVVAIAYDAGGRELATVEVRGVNGYDFTGRMLAWGASHAAAEGLAGAGALGPAEAFGLDRLEAGCAEAGIERAS